MLYEVITEIQNRNPSGIEEVRQSESVMIRLSEGTQEKHIQLKQFLRNNLYKHERVKLMTREAKERIRELSYNFV